MFAKIRPFLDKNSTSILTGLIVTGIGATVFLAVRPTTKALQLIADEEYERSPHQIELTKFEVIKLVYPLYVPAVVMGGLTVAGVIFLNSMHTRRNAALATVYAISEAALKEYQDKIIETIGSKKAQKLKDEIYEERLLKDPLSKNTIIFTGKGETLCYDAFSGRYFKSDIETIRRVRNELNYTLLLDNFISLNDLYYALGLPNNKVGEELGWNMSGGQIDFVFSSQLAEDGVPCLVIDYKLGPKFDYD
jgi:hypothetical protein